MLDPTYGNSIVHIEGKVEGFLLPGALRTAPYPAKGKGLGSGTRTALSSESNLSIVVIGNYSGRPDNGGTMPGKSKPFTPLVDPISPPSQAASSARMHSGHPKRQQEAACGGGAGYRPRVRKAYSDRVYHHSRTNPALLI